MNFLIHNQAGQGRRRQRQAFTLVEMLVVIAIIGILAALTVAGMQRASGTSKIKRVETELRQIESAIAAYHAALSFYPPDNPDASSIPYDLTHPQRRFRGVTNQLYYELMGTVLVNNQFQTVNKAENITTNTLRSFFKADGVANSIADASEARAPFLVPKARQFGEISATPDVEVLLVPLEWTGPDNEAPVAGQKINPWRYDSSSTNRHNPTGYDLWAEFYVGKRKIIKGNWKE